MRVDPVSTTMYSNNSLALADSYQAPPAAPVVVLGAAI